ncbi:hypothetical protein MalM25_36970 [Planctomycetes bacterium MalM25]|nr:hypothetical protein MalM25_36970 [Planctomycetes bacterium MalM25]
MPGSFPQSPASETGVGPPSWAIRFFSVQFGLFLFSTPFLSIVRGHRPSVEEELFTSLLLGLILVLPMLFGVWASWSPLPPIHRISISVAATSILGVCFTLGDAEALLIAIVLFLTWTVVLTMARLATGLRLDVVANAIFPTDHSKLRLSHLLGIMTAVAMATAWAVSCIADWRGIRYWIPSFGDYVLLMLPAVACVILVLSRHRRFLLALFLLPGITLIFSKNR